MRVVQLQEYTSKQFLNPTSNPKIAHYGPINQNYPKIKSNSKVRIEGSIEIKSCSTT